MDKREVKIKDARAEAKRIAIIANGCFKNPLFMRYRQKAFEMEVRLLKELMEYTDPDPIHYAFVISEMISAIKFSKALLNNIEDDVKKGG